MLQSLVLSSPQPLDEVCRQWVPGSRLHLWPLGGDISDAGAQWKGSPLTNSIHDWSTAFFKSPEYHLILIMTGFDQISQTWTVKWEGPTVLSISYHFLMILLNLTEVTKINDWIIYPVPCFEMTNMRQFYHRTKGWSSPLLKLTLCSLW